jgi:hypothetical protein
MQNGRVRHQLMDKSLSRVTFYTVKSVISNRALEVKNSVLFIQNPKVIYRVHKRPPVNLTLSQIQILAKQHFHFHSILPSTGLQGDILFIYKAFNDAFRSWIIQRQLDGWEMKDYLQRIW